MYTINRGNMIYKFKGLYELGKLVNLKKFYLDLSNQHM